MNRFLAVSLAAALAATAGCGSTTSPDNITAAVAMGQTVGTIRAFTSTTSGSTVTVLGGIGTPYPCYTFAASVETSGKIINVTVTGTPKPNVGCVAVIYTADYTLTLTGMPAGSWTLRVSNQVGTDAPQQKYETALSIGK